ncbi:CBS domain-containing protein [Suttonella sp. R2A3]|uniref:CBS domain-containing protein n=1 Tax=Suttonella sp. R2A3 TaxID=2908648 RepID=UPI0038FC0A47
MKNWQSILLSPKTSIRDAMRCLDQGSLRICMVVNDRQQLLGTVTDGEVIPPP